MVVPRVRVKTARLHSQAQPTLLCTVAQTALRSKPSAEDQEPNKVTGKAVLKSLVRII
jgi:hypothetical protein